MRRTMIPALLALLLCASTFANAQTARQIAQKTIPSVVLLVMEDSNGQPMSLGSGFFVQRDVIATSLHVAEGASGGYAKVVGQERTFDIVGHVGIDAQRDLILLKVLGASAPPLPLGESKRVAVGDEVYVVGRNSCPNCWLALEKAKKENFRLDAPRTLVRRPPQLADSSTHPSGIPGVPKTCIFEPTTPCVTQEKL